jgi:hypothetical protein
LGIGIDASKWIFITLVGWGRGVGLEGHRLGQVRGFGGNKVVTVVGLLSLLAWLDCQFPALLLGLDLLLEFLLVLHEDHLLHQNAVVRVINGLQHLVLRKLFDSVGVHVQSNISPLILQVVIELGLEVDSLKHHRVGDVVFFSWFDLKNTN